MALQCAPLAPGIQAARTRLQALTRNRRTRRPDAKGDAQVEDTTRARVPKQGTGAEAFVVGLKVL
jgi:hypothetical protein